MIPRGRSQHFPSNRGGRGGRTIIQHENQRLIASNITNTASSLMGNTQDNSLFNEFFEYKKKREQKNKNTATYANIAAEEKCEESDSFFYEKTFAKEVILLLDYKDLQFQNEP